MSIDIPHLGPSEETPLDPFRLACVSGIKACVTNAAPATATVSFRKSRREPCSSKFISVNFFVSSLIILLLSILQRTLINVGYPIFFG
jgi:hypothetical protein